MRNRIKIPVIVFMLLVMVLPLAAACAQQAQPTPTPVPTATPTVKKPAEFVLNAIQDLSGPYATSMAASVAAFDDFWPWFNEQGGIDGVKIKWVWHDTQGDRAKAFTAYNKFRDDKPAIFVAVSGLDSEALAQRCLEDKIVCFTSSATTKGIWPPGWVFGQAGSYEDLSGAFIDWLSEDWAKRGESRKCRLACFNPDIGAGHSSASDEFLEYVKTKPNIEVVLVEYFDYKALDLSTDITKVMQNKPDYIFGFYYATSGGAFFKSVVSAGFQGKVKLASLLWGLQPEIVTAIGKEPVEGLVGPHSVPPFLPDTMKPVSSGMELVDKLFKQNKRPATFRSSGYSNPMFCGFLFSNVIKKAVDEAGGWDKLTGQAVYDSTIKIREINCGDIAVWGISAGKRTSDKYQINEFKDGVGLPITPWKTTPDIRPKAFRASEYGWNAAGWPSGYFK